MALLLKPALPMAGTARLSLCFRASGVSPPLSAQGMGASSRFVAVGRRRRRHFAVTCRSFRDPTPLVHVVCFSVFAHLQNCIFSQQVYLRLTCTPQVVLLTAANVLLNWRARRAGSVHIRKFSDEHKRFSNIVYLHTRRQRCPSRPTCCSPGRRGARSWQPPATHPASPSCGDPRALHTTSHPPGAQRRSCAAPSSC